MQRSATAFDYARDQSGNVQTTRQGEGTKEVNREGGEESSSNDGKGAIDHDKREGNYYAKGSYKFADTPIVTAMSTASDTNENSLQTKASLSGIVDINFKSDYFPLEKMADSFQISRLQSAAQPGRGAAGAGAGAAGGAAAPPAPAPAPSTAPAGGAGATPPAGH